MKERKKNGKGRKMMVIVEIKGWKKFGGGEKCRQVRDKEGEGLI